jgi:hypothetical protein
MFHFRKAGIIFLLPWLQTEKIILQVPDKSFQTGIYLLSFHCYLKTIIIIYQITEPENRYNQNIYYFA